VISRTTRASIERHCREHPAEARRFCGPGTNASSVGGIRSIHHTLFAARGSYRLAGASFFFVSAGQLSGIGGFGAWDCPTP
jgi:hypothetical protein